MDVVSKKKKPSSATEANEPTIDSRLAYLFLRLEARCDALEAYSVMLRKELNLPNTDKTFYGFDEVTKAILQKKLEDLEDKNPDLAAEISRWQTEKDLPDKFL
jgi:cell division protein FtsB